MANDSLIDELANALAMCAQKLLAQDMRDKIDAPSFELTQAVDLLRRFKNDSGLWWGAGVVSMYDAHYN